jgi:hypothetical protein
MANGGLIGALRVTLGIDTAQFEAGTKRARGIARRDATAIQQELSKIRSGFNTLLTGVAATALVAAGKRALDYASSLGEVAQQAGVSAKELQEYRYAASQAGITSDEMDKALAKLTKTMGEALAGEKSQVAAFRELGVALQDANGRVYTAGELIPKLADAFAKIEDPAKRARLQTDLFGKSGQKLDTLLAGGSKAINELRDAAHRLGIVLSDEQIQNADKTADKLSELKQVLEARIAGVVADNASAIAGLADALFRLAASAAQVSEKLPGALTIAAGAAIGGKVGKAPGALLGGLAGLTYELYDRSQNDTYGVKGMSNADLAKRARKLAGEVRGGRNDETANNVASAINQEVARRIAARNAPKPTPQAAVGDGALPVASGSGGRKPKRGPKDRSSEYLERFNREMASLNDEELRLKQDITTDVRERARLEHLRIETEEAAYNIDVDSREKSGELTKAQAEALRLQHAQNAQKQHTLVNWELDDQLTEQELDLKRSVIEIDTEVLRNQLDAARTQEDRRRIQLRILDKEIEMERAALEAVKARHATTDIEYQIAEAKLKQLDSTRGAREAAVKRDTMGPLERYVDSLPKDAKELNEAYQSVAAEGLQSLNDGLADAILQSKSLGDVFGNIADQIINDLARIAIQQAIIKPLAKMLFGEGGNGSGGGGILSAIGSLFGGASGGGSGSKTTNLPKLATGGSFKVGGLAGTDRNVLAINGIPRVRVSADEKINVERAGQDNERPIVVYVTGEEGAAFVPRVAGIAGTQSAQVVAGTVRRQARAGRARLA